MLFLADSLPQADPQWGMQALTWSTVIFGLTAVILGIILVFRRTPSIDVDVQSFKGHIERLDEKHETLEKKVDEHIRAVTSALEKGANLHLQFAEKQAENAATLKAVDGKVDDLGKRLNNMPTQIVDQLKNVNLRRS